MGGTCSIMLSVNNKAEFCVPKFDNKTYKVTDVCGEDNIKTDLKEVWRDS